MLSPFRSQLSNYTSVVAMMLSSVFVINSAMVWTNGAIFHAAILRKLPDMFSLGAKSVPSSSVYIEETWRNRDSGGRTEITRQHINSQGVFEKILLSTLECYLGFIRIRILFRRI